MLAKDFFVMNKKEIVVQLQDRVTLEAQAEHSLVRVKEYFQIPSIAAVITLAL